MNTNSFLSTLQVCAFVLVGTSRRVRGRNNSTSESSVSLKASSGGVTVGLLICAEYICGGHSREILNEEHSPLTAKQKFGHFGEIDQRLEIGSTYLI